MKKSLITSFGVILSLFFLVEIPAKAQEKITISGFVKENGSEELLPGVTIYVEELKTGTATNSYGFYSLTLPKGSYTVHYSYVGYEPYVTSLALEKDKRLDIALENAITQLGEVEVNAERQERRSQVPQMSKISLPVTQIQNMPSLLGEKDVLKVLQLLPGVQSGREGSTGLNVRGSGADQNLLILDDAVVYNANHLFGFFSVFNGDALKNVELYKGGFPARFGGRAASVLKLDMKEGNKESYHGKASVGLLSSSAVFEGPIVKNKASFLLAGRRSYADLLLKPFQINKDQFGYFFHDFNAKLNADLGEKDRLYLSGYFGQDEFGIKEVNSTPGSYFKHGIEWGNATVSMRWNHLFNPKLFANASVNMSDYNFTTYGEEKDPNNFEYARFSSKVRDYSFKYDLDFVPNPKHHIRAGLTGIDHYFEPDAYALHIEEYDVHTEEENVYHTQEAAVYLEDHWKPFPALSIEGGLRVSFFRQDEKTYVQPEPRLSLAYRLKDDLSIKASYSKMSQYLHLLTNSGLGLPTDLWVPATDKIAPQFSEQWAGGIHKDFTDKDISVSLEGYYKTSSNVINYKDGASFALMDGETDELQKVNWEENVTQGRGWSYGAELFLQKKYGRFSGWAGYTLAWTYVQFDELNYKEPFFPKHDRRHDLTLAGVYELKPGVTVSASWIFGSGNAFTISKQRYHTPYNTLGALNPGGSSDYYNYRGNFRGEAYHRLDLGIQFTKQKKHWKRTWDLSLYNAYMHSNPLYYTTGYDWNAGGAKQVRRLKKMSLFPVLPGVSYRIEF